MSNKEQDDYSCPPLHHALLYAMLMKVNETFEKEKIQYFLDGGSLLGCVRDKGIIKHDDDIDLGIFDKQFEKASLALEKLCQNFVIEVETNENEGENKTKETKKYEVKFCREKGWDYMLKIYVPDLWCENIKSKKIFGTPTLDIFSYTKAGDKIKLSNHRQRLEFKNCYYLKTEMFPLTLRDFGPVKAYTAFQQKPYLFRYYGKDCLEKVKIDTRQAENPKLKTRENITL